MITGQVTEQEYISAHQLHRRRLVSVLNRAMVVAVLAGLLLTVAVSRRWGMVLVFGGLGGLFGEFVQGRVFLPSKLRRLYAQVRGRTDVSYAWDDEHLF